MQFIDFLNARLKEMAKNFPFLSIDLEQNDISGMFFIKISPIEQFRNSKDIKAAIKEFYLAQLEKFPDESLTFISDDSYYKMSNPILKIVPKEYYNIRYDVLSHDIFDLLSLFQSYNPVWETHIRVYWDVDDFQQFKDIGFRKQAYTNRANFIRGCGLRNIVFGITDLDAKSEIIRKFEPTIEKLTYAS